MICLSVVQSSTYVLLLAIGYRTAATAPIFADIPPGTQVVDPVVQALTLTDVVVEATVTALLLALAVQAHKRFGTLDPGRAGARCAAERARARSPSLVPAAGGGAARRASAISRRLLVDAVSLALAAPWRCAVLRVRPAAHSGRRSIVDWFGGWTPRATASRSGSRSRSTRSAPGWRCSSPC